MLWLWHAVAAGSPELCYQQWWRGGGWLLWQGQRLILVGYLGWALYETREEGISHTASGGLLLGVGCQLCGGEERWVDVVRQEVE